MYTTIPIIDSQGTSGPWLNFTPPVQTFQCSQSLVRQTAVVDVGSREVSEIQPSIHKTSSTWLPSGLMEPGPGDPTTENAFIDAVRDCIDIRIRD
jgi:hypothetical protein